jgi:hypothetical protein
MLAFVISTIIVLTILAWGVAASVRSSRSELYAGSVILLSLPCGAYSLSVVRAHSPGWLSAVLILAVGLAYEKLLRRWAARRSTNGCS